MLKPVRLLAECYDKHFAFLIYVQLKAINDRLHTSVRNDFKVKKLMNQKICMPVEDCFISIIELKPLEVPDVPPKMHVATAAICPFPIVM